MILSRILYDLQLIGDNILEIREALHASEEFVVEKLSVLEQSHARNAFSEVSVTCEASNITEDPVPLAEEPIVLGKHLHSCNNLP